MYGVRVRLTDDNTYSYYVISKDLFSSLSVLEQSDFVIRYTVVEADFTGFLTQSDLGFGDMTKWDIVLFPEDD